MSDQTLDTLRRHAVWFEPAVDGFATLFESIGDADLVLIGEASHGTHEFYRARAELTKALIERAGFNIVAVEADWPDAYRVNRWVRHASRDGTPEEALGDFVRFPRWMWRNREVVEFVDWLRNFNGGKPPAAHAGFYGLDLYSLHTSADAVLTYLRKIDPDAAERAKFRYGCFEDFREDTQAYGYASRVGLTPSCEHQVIDQLVDLRRRAADYMARDGFVAADEYFFAEQNARLVRNAEGYYRAMFGGRVDSWNLRDTHMMETLDALMAHVRQGSGTARAVVWAHNSHLGDARATDMHAIGEINLGQLVRERRGNQSYLIGFTTHAGTVTAADDWDDPTRRKRVRPSLEGSYERLFHDSGLERFLLLLRDDEVRAALQASRLERAIGVIYRPETERMSHYFRAWIAQQFDAVLHVDETRALEPLEPWSIQEADLPETYPSAY
jgi:erythromycin esterase-like protein